MDATQLELLPGGATVVVAPQQAVPPATAVQANVVVEPGDCECTRCAGCRDDTYHCGKGLCRKYERRRGNTF